jgi:hypothetical protein
MTKINLPQGPQDVSSSQLAPRSTLTAVGVSGLSSYGIDCITNYRDLGERVPRWPDIY